MPPTLELDVEARLSGSFAVRAALSLSPGVTLFTGPSGAGKTTLARIIAGLHRPQRGTIRFGEQPWLDTAEAIDVPAAERQVGLVMQSLALFPHLSVLDNVAFGLRGPAAKRRERALHWLALLRIEAIASRRITSLSGGEAQRVAIARALAPEPRVIVLDEPFSALDAALRATLTRELEPLFADNERVVAVVTHSPDEWKHVRSRFEARDGHFHSV